MNAVLNRRHQLAAVLGGVGGLLGIAAGVTQATVGSRIPLWSGDKAEPVALGLLTVVLSVLACIAAVRQRSSSLTTASRAGTALGLLTPGLLCLTTVGRLWYLPGLLLVTAGFLSVDSIRRTASVISRNWLRCLLGLLGASELVMAAGASPLLMVVGIVGGIALVAAARLVSASRMALVGLVVLGTVPFAALAWTAVVPVLLVMVTAVVAIPLIRHAPIQRRVLPSPSA